MAINKNFVVKNGLEVSTDLILADADRNKVGIGSTTPRTELDVRGGIAATDLNISGVATIATLRAVTGIVTDLLATNITAGLGTFSVIQVTDITSSGISTATSLNVTGIATIAVGIVTNLRGTNLNYSGIGTIQNGQITTLDSTSVRTSNFYATGVSTIASLSVTGSTFDTLTVNNFTTLNGITTVANARVTNLNVSGVSTLGTVQISSGIVTATSGVVTYYGDASYLTGNARNLTATIGIGTTGGVVGYGISFINFYGTGVSTAYYNSSAGIATIFFEGGGSGTIGIGTAFPPSGNANGDLFYHANYGKLFVYYDETIIGVGTDAYWVDAAPSNVGVITGLTNVSFYPGSASSPSIYIIGDSQTGLFSPSSGNITFVSTGSSVLNINQNGISVTGITTSSGGFVGNLTGNISGDATGLSGVPNVTVSNVTSGNINSSGIVTASNKFVGALEGNINSSGVSSISNLAATNINATGISTISNLVATDMNVTGVSTFASLRATNVNTTGVTTSSGGFVGNLTGNLTGNATGLSGVPDITVNNIVGVALTLSGNLTVNGTQTIINTQILDVADKTIGIGSTSTPSDSLADGAGIVVYGTTNKTLTYNNTKKSFEANIPIASNEIRFVTVSEKITRVDGNIANLVYSTNSSNVAICTNPTGNITLNITGIPTSSDFDSNAITFTVLSNATAGTAYSCLTVNLNGFASTIRWAGGSSQVATAGLTTTSGYTVYSFSGINTVGSASTTANYIVLGTVSGGYF